MSTSTAPGTVLTLPVARDVPAPGLAALLAEVRAVADRRDDGYDRFEAGLDDAWDDGFDGGSDHADRSDVDAEWDDEFAAQDLALAGESAALRARADRWCASVGAGAAVEPGAIEAVLRAFRSYEPFLGARDRRLNAAAYRRLAGATAPAHRQVA